MKKGLVVLDNGHGGMIAGQYQTSGKRSPNWSKGVLYEGMFNRWFVNRLIEKLDRNGIPYIHASPELTDVPLSTRVSRTNQAYSKYHKDYDIFFLSVHANAGGGRGIEIFTSRGETGSDQRASELYYMIEDARVNVMRYDYTDGDPDKEADFTVLAHTVCDAMLLEVGFMDQKDDYKNLWNERYLNSLVNVVFEYIKSQYVLSV